MYTTVHCALFTLCHKDVLKLLNISTQYSAQLSCIIHFMNIPKFARSLDTQMFYRFLVISHTAMNICVQVYLRDIAGSITDTAKKQVSQQSK